MLDELPRPTRDKQRLLVLAIEGYAYVVPYIAEPDGGLFLKTVFPSCKYTAIYLRRRET